MASLKYLHHDMDEHLSVLYHLLGEDNEQAKKYIEQLNSKKQQLHGIGIHSIRNTLDQYNGKFTWSYDEDEKIFCCMIVIQCCNYLKSKSEKK